MNTPVQALYALFSLFLITILAFSLYREYVLDAFRQRIFALRDSMFDDAARGALDFASPAYGMMRSTMNGMIRFGHRLNFPLLIALHAYSNHRGSESSPFSQRLEAHMEKLPEAQKRLLDGYHFKLNLLVLGYLVYSSPLLLITVIFPLAFMVIAKRHIDKLMNLARRPLDKIDAVALCTVET